MGNFDAKSEESQAALKATKLLCKYLCKERRLVSDFTVYGLKQVRPFDRPSHELYSELQKWDKWVSLGLYSAVLYQRYFICLLTYLPNYLLSLMFTILQRMS